MSSSVSSGRSAASASAACGDDPFALIERGNAMESSGNLWSAADAFGRASVLLRSEASNVAEEISQIEAATSSTAESESMKRKSVTERAAIRSRKLTEKRKIAALYLEQSRSYLGRARRCLLNALQFETQEDERRSKALQDSNVGPMGRRLRVLMEQAEPLVGMLPPNEARRRRRIFARIYAGGEEEEVAEAAAAERKAAAKEAEEKKEDKAEAEEGRDAAAAAADAEAEADADADAEMEAALLEEMDAEFGSSIPTAPGSASAEAKPKFDSEGKDEDNELNIDIPAAPSPGLPTLPKKAADDMLFIPHAPEDGAGHIERSGKPSATPPQPPSAAAAAAAAAGFPLPPEAPTCGAGSSGDVTSSLEARMAQLNATLPPGIKSHDERMEDIQRGLGRLGLSLPDHKNSIAKVFQHHTDKTEEEQIRDIMDMAADEARIEGAEEAEVSKALAAANAAGGGAKGAEGEGDELVINDADDLNAVLAKAGLTTYELKSEVAKIEDVLGEDGKKALRDLNDGGQAVADRAKALSLIGAAQELLFEASAHLEDEIEQVDEEEEEIMAAGEQDDDNGDEDARDRKDKNNKSGKKKESDALRRGRAGLVGAVRCLEKAIAALPK